MAIEIALYQILNALARTVSMVVRFLRARSYSSRGRLAVATPTNVFERHRDEHGLAYEPEV
jgi:hypothetical protein